MQPIHTRYALETEYRGWNITIQTDENMCAHYSFDITSPTGYTQHVSMGGKDEQSALRRAKEMIDLECEFADSE